MNDIPLYKVILEFEKEYDPFQYQIEEISLWSLLRFNTHEKLLLGMNRSSPRDPNTDEAIQNNARYVLQLFRDFRKLKSQSPNKNQIFVLTSSDRLREKDGDTYKNIFFDFFEPKIPDTVFWYGGNKNYNRVNLRKNNVISQKFLSTKLLKSFLTIQKNRSQIESLHNSLIGYFKSKNLAQYFNPSLKLWKKKLIDIFSRYYAFRDILLKTRPRLILIEGAYGKKWAIAAAQQCQIPVWELQHGIVYSGHLGYTFLPETRDRYPSALCRPNKFLTYGQYFTDLLINEHIFKTDEVHTLGMPLFEINQKNFQTKQNDNNNACKILICSQWVLVDELREFLIQSAPKLPQNIHIQLKPHPAESKAQIQSYKNISNQISIMDQNTSLYEAFSGVGVHCAVFSTTLFESIGLGIPTIVLNLPGHENAVGVINSGAAKFAESPEAFCEILEDYAQNEKAYNTWKMETQKQKNHFWAESPSQTLHRLITNHVQQQSVQSP